MSFLPNNLPTDRRSIDPKQELGWPGVSREMWSVAKGADGAEGYGWGATLPAHIIRSIFGVRENRQQTSPQFELGPNLPHKLFEAGRAFGLRNIHYRGYRFDLRYEFAGEEALDVQILTRRSATPKGVRVATLTGEAVEVHAIPTGWRFTGKNHAVYAVIFED